MTIKEIAQILNVSATTVSNVIRGKTKEVSPKTVEKVNAYLREVNYIPNMSAQNLALNRSNILGFVLMTSDYRGIEPFKDPFVAELIGSVEEAVRKAGFFVMLYISNNTDEIIEYFSRWNVDGLILFAPDEKDVLKINSVYHKPIAFIDAYLTGDTKQLLKDRAVNVGLNDEDATAETVKYLVSKGHRKIGFLSRSLMGVDIARYNGYRKAMENAGLMLPETNKMVLFEESGSHSYVEMASKSRNLTAVITCSDSSAIFLINAFNEIGVHVPEDVSVIGFDDSSVCEYSRPALTTVRQDIRMKGETAVRILINLIDGESIPGSTVTLPTRLIERRSVRVIR
jgi:LacI family transcriptional regulator